MSEVAAAVEGAEADPHLPSEVERRARWILARILPASRCTADAWRHAEGLARIMLGEQEGEEA